MLTKVTKTQVIVLVAENKGEKTTCKLYSNPGLQQGSFTAFRFHVMLIEYGKTKETNKNHAMYHVNPWTPYITILIYT